MFTSLKTCRPFIMQIISEVSDICQLKYNPPLRLTEKEKAKLAEKEKQYRQSPQQRLDLQSLDSFGDRKMRPGVRKMTCFFTNKTFIFFLPKAPNSLNAKESGFGEYVLSGVATLDLD